MSLMMSTTLLDSFVAVCYKGASGAYSTGEYIVYGTHPAVNRKLRELDLDNTMSSLRLLCNENMDVIAKYPSLTLLHSSIIQTCNSIDTTLIKVKQKLDIHNQSLLKYWTNPDCDLLFDTLYVDVRILEKRYTSFLHVLSTCIAKSHTQNDNLLLSC